MAPGFLHYTSITGEAGNCQPASPSLRGCPWQEPLVLAVLDEIQSAIKADAIALVDNISSEEEVKIQIGRGAWNGWTGYSIQLDPKTITLLSSMAEIELDNGRGMQLPHPSYKGKGVIQKLYNTPLVSGDGMMGTIWVGHRSEPTEQGLRLLTSVGSLISDTLYKTNLVWPREPGACESLQSLVKRLAEWDMPTFNHSLRTVPWVKATALAMGCHNEEAQVVSWAALLHDLGKMGIPKSILHKPGPLTDEEWALMKLHPGIGARLVASAPRLSRACEMIEAHHEKFDGRGYPFGRKGNQIPLGGRIIAVVDAYAAMTEERAYKTASTHEEAIQEILDCSGTHFDPRVSAAFIEQFR